jgi:hypothetical protein
MAVRTSLAMPEKPQVMQITWRRISKAHRARDLRRSVVGVDVESVSAMVDRSWAHPVWAGWRVAGQLADPTGWSVIGPTALT